MKMLRNNIRNNVWLLLAGMIVLGGCDKDVRLTGKNLRPDVKVRTVEHYGVTLDQSATPKQVAFVVLRAVRDDALASGSQDREAALDRQFDVCAAAVIGARAPSALTQAEYRYNVVYHWTPTVAHYVNDFETDWTAAESRLFVAMASPAEGEAAKAPDRCVVRMAVADPGGDSNAGAVLLIYMTRDGGYWRVLHFGFDPNRRTIPPGVSGG